MLTTEFGGDVEVIGQPDEGMTGNFEVTIAQTGALLHSKTKNGSGRCENSVEQQVVIDKLQAYIDTA